MLTLTVLNKQVSSVQELQRECNTLENKGDNKIIWQLLCYFLTVSHRILSTISVFANFQEKTACQGQSNLVDISFLELGQSQNKFKCRTIFPANEPFFLIIG